MAKFDVESKSGKVFDLQWHLTSLKNGRQKYFFLNYGHFHRNIAFNMCFLGVCRVKDLKYNA